MTRAYNPGPQFKLVSSYGKRIDPLTGEAGKFHSGQDFAARPGTPIPAATFGTVVYSGYNKNLGNVVIVKNDTGEYSLYGHMQAGNQVRLGQQIWQGDTIGLVGSTGARTTGNHLHYSIITKQTGKRITGASVDGSIGITLDDTATIDPARYADYDPSPRYLDETRRAAQLMSGAVASTDSSDIRASRETRRDWRQSDNNSKPLYLDETRRAARVISEADMGTIIDDRALGRQNSFDDRFKEWGSSPAAISSQSGSDLPGSFNDRFGNWGSVPADDYDNPRSPVLRTLQNYRRSMAPDGSVSGSARTASLATPAFQPDEGYSPAAFGAQASGSDPRTLGESESLAQRMARIFNGAGQFVEDGLVSPAEAAPLPRIPSGPTAPDLPDDEAPAVVKKRGPYLSSRVVYPSQASPDDATVPATPNVQDAFNDRFGDGVPSPAGIVPRNPTELTQTPPAAAPPAIFTGRSMPSEPLPHWLFGLTDNSTTTDDGAEDWFNRWIRSYLER